MRKSIPETRINRISNTIKSLRRNRPVSKNNTGKNLSHDILYNPGTEGLNNRLFKNHPSKFISIVKGNKKPKYNYYILDIWRDYYEETNS